MVAVVMAVVMTNVMVSMMSRVIMIMTMDSGMMNDE